MGSADEYGQIQMTETTEMDSPDEERQPSSEFGESDVDRPRRDGEEFSEEDEGVPLKRSRNGKWWFATYHNITAIVGSGVLGLPTAMVYFGWEGGIIVLVMSWCITLFTLWEMVEMYEIKGLRRSSTYHQLGQKAFGERLGLWVVLPQQLTVFIGTNIVYMVTGSQSLWLFYQLIRCNIAGNKQLDAVALGSGDQCCGKIGRSTFTAFFAVLQFFFVQLDGFNSIASISLGASVMTIWWSASQFVGCFLLSWIYTLTLSARVVCSYCIIAAVESVRQGKKNHSPPSQLVNPHCLTSYSFLDEKTVNQVFNAFSGLGVVAFAYAGHNVVLEIQDTLPSSKEKPSKYRMWRGVMVAYIIVALCYFPVAICGYWAYGNKLALVGNSTKNPGNSNILLQIGTHHQKVIAAANLMVFIHLMGSYLVYAMPAFDLLETFLVEKYHIIYLIENIFVKFRFQRPTQKRSITVMRLVTRSVYVSFTGFIAITFPFFGDLLAFFGGFAFTPTSYFLPCIIWLLLKKPPAYTKSWFVNWFCIIIGVLLTICATIGGMADIIRSAGNYQFYQSFTCNSTANVNSNSSTCPNGVHFKHEEL